MVPGVLAKVGMKVYEARRRWGAGPRGRARRGAARRALQRPASTAPQPSSVVPQAMAPRGRLLTHIHAPNGPWG